MRILYAIQGTGNGHISRARDIIPLLEKRGELDILISGTDSEVDLGYPVKFQFKGLGFTFGKKGGIDLLATYKKSNLRRLFKEINELPVEEYDLVINDFEPVSAWACKAKNKKCVSLSHQAAVINKKSPKPEKNDLVGKAILNHYAPVTVSYGFHFNAYDKNIYTPVIRKQIRNAVPARKPHYTVYLPAYDDKRIINVLQEIKNIQWEVFSKHTKKEFKSGKVHVRPIDNQKFIESFINCTGMLCGAGFETPAEAMYLNKKLLVIPMKGQYEQQCNAAALKDIGIPVIKSLKKKHIEKLQQWTDSPQMISASYPDITDEIINTILKQELLPERKETVVVGNLPYSVKKLKKLSLGKILNQIAG